MEIPPDILFGYFANIATLITVIIIFFTLQEMKKNRKMVYQPALMMPQQNVFWFERDSEAYFGFKFKKSEYEDVYYYEPKIPLYNIGMGPGKNIMIAWDCNFEAFKEELGNMINIEQANINGHIWNLEYTLREDIDYILPSSINLEGISLTIPGIYMQMLHLFLEQGWQETMKDGAEYNINEHLSKLSLKVELKYRNIENDNFKNTFIFIPRVNMWTLNHEENVSDFVMVLNLKKEI